MKIDLSITEKGQPVSDDFEMAFSSRSGGCRRECECGRTLFDYENSYDWEDGELEALKVRADADPKHCIGLPYSVGSYIIDGREFVMGCPCNAGAPVERFLLNHASQIADFLNRHAAELARKAAQMTVKL